MSGVKRSRDTFEYDLKGRDDNATTPVTGAEHSGSPQDPNASANRGEANNLDGESKNKRKKQKRKNRNKNPAAQQDFAPPVTSPVQPEQTPPGPSGVDDEDKPQSQWTVVGKGKGKKGQNKFNSGRPSVQHINAAQQQRPLQPCDFQDLALALMAGKQPSCKFLKINNCQAVKKVIVLAVPGLSGPMIYPPVEPSERSVNSRQFTPEGEPIPIQEFAKPGELPPQGNDEENTDEALNPDDYLPKSITEETFADPFKLLARLFDQVWPTECPGYYRRNIPQIRDPFLQLLAVRRQTSQQQQQGQSGTKRRKYLKAKKKQARKNRSLTLSTRNQGKTWKEILTSSSKDSVREEGAAFKNGAATPDDVVTKDYVAKEDVTKDQTTKAEAAKDGAYEGDAAKDNAAENDAAKDDTAQDHAAPNKAAQDDAVKDKAVTDITAKDDVANNDAAEDNAIKDGAARGVALETIQKPAKRPAYEAVYTPPEGLTSTKRRAQDERPASVPIDKFVLSLNELRANNYDVHPALLDTDVQRKNEAALRTKRKHAATDGWVDAKITTVEPHEWDGNPDNLENGFTVLAIDCEMCETAEDPMALTMVSVVGWNGESLMGELVRPPMPITDYKTEFSGVTEELMAPVTTTLQDIQARLLELFTPDTILVGHSLDSDLRALKMTHPRIVDTTCLYPSSAGPPMKNKLRFLASDHLSYKIQEGTEGHDPLEDARAALGLARLKCEQGTAYGVPPQTFASIFQVLREAPHPAKTAMIDWGDPTRNLGAYADLRVGCATDDEVVAGVGQALEEGATFVVARLRELAIARGDWAASRHADAEAARAAEEAAMVGGARSARAVDDAAGRFVGRLAALKAGLPEGTALLVLSGGGDPLPLRELVARHREHQQQLEKDSAQVTTTWGPGEARAETNAWWQARKGIAFTAVS